MSKTSSQEAILLYYGQLILWPLIQHWDLVDNTREVIRLLGLVRQGRDRVSVLRGGCCVCGYGLLLVLQILLIVESIMTPSLLHVSFGIGHTPCWCGMRQVSYNYIEKYILLGRRGFYDAITYCCIPLISGRLYTCMYEDVKCQGLVIQYPLSCHSTQNIRHLLKTPFNSVSRQHRGYFTVIFRVNSPCPGKWRDTWDSKPCNLVNRKQVIIGEASLLTPHPLIASRGTRTDCITAPFFLIASFTVPSPGSASGFWSTESCCWLGKTVLEEYRKRRRL